MRRARRWIDLQHWPDSGSWQLEENNVIRLRALQACRALRDIETGKKIHNDASTNGEEISDSYVASSLVSMYSKCGSMGEARRVFNSLPERDTVLWNTLLLGHSENARDGELVLNLLACMQHEGCPPDARSFLAGLRACINLAASEAGVSIGGKPVKLKSLERGMKLHSQAFNSGCSSNVFVINTLVDLYSRCGSMADAQRVFERAPDRIVVSWNILILGYAESGEEEEALRLYSSFREEASSSSECIPDARTYVAALKACTMLAGKEDGIHSEGKIIKPKSLQRGSAVHREASDAGFASDIFVGSSLVCMYSKCGSLVDALRVFESMPKRDAVAWTTLIIGYATNSEPEMALELFLRMENEGCVPDGVLYLAAFKACTAVLQAEESKERMNDLRGLKLRMLETGMRIHSQASKPGYDLSDAFVACSLVGMYSTCGSLLDARRVFDRVPGHNVVLWNSLLQGYAENGEPRLCLELFSEMGDCTPDSVTFVAVIGACAALAEDEQGIPAGTGIAKMSCLEKGMEIHSKAVSSECDRCKFVANTLIDMYVKCGSMGDARRVLDRMDFHDGVSWTSLLLGYSENGEEALALDLALELLSSEEPSCFRDSKVYLAALRACCELAALETGRALHGEIYRHGLESDPILRNSSVDLYSKCGSMTRAQQVFDSSPVKTDVTWGSLMTGFTRQGDSDKVFELFHQMQLEGVRATGVSFLSILTACSHAGLVDRGVGLFRSMSLKHGVAPGRDHYHCLMDLYARANRLEEAVEVVKSMPHEAGASTWRTLLGACDRSKNVGVGKAAFAKLVEADRSDGAGYKLMANIYAAQENNSRTTLMFDAK